MKKSKCEHLFRDSPKHRYSECRLCGHIKVWQGMTTRYTDDPTDAKNQSEKIYTPRF